MIYFEQDEIEKQAALFGALADSTRLKLIKLLCQQYPNALCVNALTSLLGVSQSAVSQHLKVLKSIGLVRGERRGYHIHYYVNPKIIKDYLELIPTVFKIKETRPEQICRNSCSEEEEEQQCHSEN